MKKLYSCERCGNAEFIIHDDCKKTVMVDGEPKEAHLMVPEFFPPFCPYCGEKGKVHLQKEVG